MCTSILCICVCVSYMCLFMYAYMYMCVMCVYAVCICVCVYMCIVCKCVSVCVFHEVRDSMAIRKMFSCWTNWRLVLFFCPRALMLPGQPWAPISTIRVTNSTWELPASENIQGFSPVWDPWGLQSPLGCITWALMIICLSSKEREPLTRMEGRAASSKSRDFVKKIWMSGRTSAFLADSP